MVPNPADAKRHLRMEIRQRRRSRTAAERVAAGQAIRDHLATLITSRSIARVACYLSTDEEPDTRQFLTWAAENGIEVLLPISRTDGTLDWVAADGADEREGLFGIFERVGPVLQHGAIETLDLLIIPAAAVDRTGMRMGWGRGYFDRTLSTMSRQPPVVAVVFDDELVDEVPREHHDKPVDGVVTPAQLLAFGLG